MENFKLDQIDEQTYRCTDIVNDIVCTFKKGRYNDTQQFNFDPQIIVGKTPNDIARIVAEFGRWLRENHYDIAMPQIESTRSRIARRLREVREQKGVSQDKLAESAGLDRSHISRIEGGKYNVTIDVLDRLASGLGYHIDFVSDVD